MEVVAAAPRCQLLLIVLMAAMLLLGMKVSPLLVRRKIARTIELQESIGKGQFGKVWQEHCQEDLQPEQEEPVNSDGWLLHNQTAQSFQTRCMYHFAKIKSNSWTLVQLPVLDLRINLHPSLDKGLMTTGDPVSWTPERTTQESSGPSPPDHSSVIPVGCRALSQHPPPPHYHSKHPYLP
ncbi:hypothetical protein STEG23_023108 [Scotinomys teguina]